MFTLFTSILFLICYYYFMMYPHGLNEMLDTCEDNKNGKRFKSNDGMVQKIFPSPPKLFHVDMITGKGYLF